MTANQAREIRNKTYEDAFIGIEKDPQYIAVMKAIKDAVNAKPLPKDEIHFNFEPDQVGFSNLGSDSTIIVKEKLTVDGFCVIELFGQSIHCRIEW